MAGRWKRRSDLLFADEIGSRLEDRRLSCIDALGESLLKDQAKPEAQAQLWAEIEQLDRLSRLRDSLGVRKAKRLFVPLLLIVGTTVVTWLLMTRIENTEIEIAATCRALKLKAYRDAQLTEPLPTSILRFFGNLSVTVADDRHSCEALELTNPGGAVPTLDPLIIAAGSTVNLDADNTYTRLSVQDSTPCASASAKPGTLASSCDLGPLTAAESVEVVGDGPLSIELESEALPHGIRLPGPIEIRSLELTRSHLDQDGRPVVRSSLNTGTLFFEELGDVQRPLREGQIVRFDIVHNGTLESLQLENGLWTIRFRGTVKNLRIRRGNTDVSLMPTRLAWLTSQPDLARWYTSAVALFGMLLAVFRWWRPHE